MNKWDIRWLQLAQFISNWSKDPSTKVGAVVAIGKEEISKGYNGFARGENDHPLLYKDREYKYKHILHAEDNALERAEGYDLSEATFYTWPCQPCAVCTQKLIDKGVKRIVTVAPTQDMLDRWKDSFEESQKLLDSAGVEILFYSGDQLII